MNSMQQIPAASAILPDTHGGFGPCPTVMTEEKLVRFLRIPEISGAVDYRNVVQNLKRVHGLPRIHLCGRAVYLTDAVKQWLQQRVTCGR